MGVLWDEDRLRVIRGTLVWTLGGGKRLDDGDGNGDQTGFKYSFASLGPFPCSLLTLSCRMLNMSRSFLIGKFD